jgi:phage shock protein E
MWRSPLFLALFGLASAATAAEPPNPNIDMPGFLAVATEAAEARASRRVSEAEFLRMAREPGTVVLDARSRAKYDELHVAGAVNLSFPDFTAESLARAIPARDARVLIYCNNNFENAPGPFPTKLPSASLNLSTFVALYDYGYRNVYELAPLVDPARSRIPFESAPPRG